ncbi:MULTISPECIES: YitT family protein [unclassified Streptomyces]|uniref:YczE/YyaS/YitT family protein n=1 Tax=unclassified Streptomyces TaxID=2593676 RepID=UPI0008DD7052|nr:MULTISPECIES: hypothetical protein [unclassified Streptomyces]OII70365.1 hypothetical protein BJP39_13810 [Streptomyces sp. CC77]
MPIKKKARKGYVSYPVGCLVFSCGAFLFIRSALGTDPLDVFALGLGRHVPVTVGVAQLAVAVLCLGAVAVWTRERPALSPLFTFFFCGSVVDVLTWADAGRSVHLHPAALLVPATLLCAYGSALIIMSGFGIRAVDLLALTVTSRLRWPFWAAKGAIETALMVAGFLMGGPLGVGTVVFLAGVDLLVQPLMAANSRILRLPNRGFPEMPSGIPSTIG